MKFKILWLKSQLGRSFHFVQISNLAFLFIHFTKFASSSWIGLRKTRERNNFQWSDNSVFDYSYWRYRYYSYSKYQCVRSGIDGKWETTNCTEKYPFTCKITRNSDDPNLSFVGNCTEGWSKINDKCYKTFKGYKSWAAARESCKGFGGNLATITSQKLESKIISLAGSVYRNLWIG